MLAPESHIRTMQRFKSLWSSVSKLKVGKDVPDTTQAAIIRGYEKAYGPEEQGREHEG
jgi:hypothetical protein